MDRPIILISAGKFNRGASTNQVQEVETGVDINYVESVLRAGGVPMILPRIADVEAVHALAASAQAVLISGGGDVASYHYGEEPHQTARGVDPVRDDMEIALVKIAAELRLPVLGICRGMQILNVAAGGTLIQDIPSQVDGAHQHRTDALAPIAAHSVEVERDSLLQTVVGSTRLMVNSYHHQAVKDVGNGLRVTAWSRDGVVEGFEAIDDRVLLAVQWHPEELSATDPASRALFDWIVERARRYAERAAATLHEGSVVRVDGDQSAEFDVQTAAVDRIADAIVQHATHEAAAEIHIESVSTGAVIN